MTTNALTQDWVNHPFGKTLRVLVASGGVIVATMVILLATLGTSSVWFLTLLGLTLAATAVRAAIEPTLLRLTIVLAAVVAIPIAGLIL